MIVKWEKKVLRQSEGGTLTGAMLFLHRRLVFTRDKVSKWTVI